MKRQLFFGVLLIFIMAFSLYAGGSSAAQSAAPAAGGKVTLPAYNPNNPAVTVTLLQQGWNNVAVAIPNPVDEWIKRNYNINFMVTCVSNADFMPKATTLFAAGDSPDLLSHMGGNKNTLLLFYDQGVMCDDLTPFLDYIPTRKALITPEVKQSISKDGKIFGLPNVPNVGFEGWFVRKDWLTKLGLSYPKTTNEFLDMLRKFTNSNLAGPDVKTYGITVAAGGQGPGSILREFNQLMHFYGPSGFHVVNNKVEHEMTNGVRKQTLDLVRAIVKEGLVNPDWMTVNQESRKAQLFKGAYGLTNYGNALAAECESAYNQDGSTLGWWEYMDWLDFSGNGSAGKGPAFGLSSTMLGVSKKATADLVKMERICSFVDAATFPNKGYMLLRWNIGFEDAYKQFNYLTLAIPGGGMYWSNAADGPWHWRPNFAGAADYGAWIATNADLVMEGRAHTVPAVVNVQMTQRTKASAAKRYTGESQLLNLDQQIITDLTTMRDTFEMNYVLGIDANWDGYVQRWRSMGGDKMIAQATEQFKALGLIK